MRTTGASKRIKGISFERDVANFLKSTWESAKRGFQFRGGSESSDVDGTPYHVECKNCDRWSVLSWWRETVSDAKSTHKIPLLVMKRRQHSIGEALVVLRLSDFAEMQDRA
jgi:hypothetical protein